MLVKSRTQQYYRTIYVVELEPSDEGREDHELVSECAHLDGTTHGGVVIRGRDNRATVHIYND